MNDFGLLFWIQIANNVKSVTHSLWQFRKKKQVNIQMHYQYQQIKNIVQLKSSKKILEMKIYKAINDHYSL